MLDKIALTALHILTSRRGASSMEYALAVGLISLAALVAFQILGESVSGMFGAVNSNFVSAMPGR